MSTIVVINGLAIIVGSKPISFAIIGKSEPTNLATTTVQNKEKHTTNATESERPEFISHISIISIFMKLAHVKAPAQIIETLNSFHKTLIVSLNSISPSDKLRIMVTDD